MRKQVRIGIDPDIDKSGFCIMESAPFGKKNIVKLETLCFWDLIQAIDAYHDYDDLLVCLEAGWLNKKSNYHFAANTSIAGRIGKNVGENHAVGKLVQQYCEKADILYKLIKPESKKWDADLFKKITGYDKRTNQEQRDAVRAAW